MTASLPAVDGGESREEENAMLKAVEQVLNERVRPALRAHGGEVKVVELEGAVLRVELLGQCSGCPSACLTTESLIEKEITEALPEIRRVVLVQTVDESLLAQARALLGRHHG